MIEREHQSLSVSRQCRLLGVSRSTLYYRPLGESAATLELMRRIDELYLKYPFYGSRQMVRHWRLAGSRRPLGALLEAVRPASHAQRTIVGPSGSATSDKALLSTGRLPVYATDHVRRPIPGLPRPQGGRLPEVPHTLGEYQLAGLPISDLVGLHRPGSDPHRGELCQRCKEHLSQWTVLWEMTGTPPALSP